MNKLAIAVLLSAGTLVSFQANAGGPAIVGAVEGAIVGAHFGGAHGAVAGAIVGAAIGSAVEEPYYDRGYRQPARYEREPARYAPAPARTSYYAPPVSYQPYYEPYDEPYYEPRRVVYVQPRVYSAYPAYYPAPVYVRYASSSRGHYNRHRHGHHNYRGRY